MSVKLVIFDWDGTLMDSQAKIVSCMQMAAKACDIAVPKDEDVKQIIGISLLPAIKQLFALSDSKQDEALAEKLRDAYKSIYFAQDQTPCPLFKGVPELLNRLQSLGVQMAVATGKARRGLERAWEQTGTKSYFVASRTADEAQSKPSSDMLEQLLDELGADASETIMVGDTTYDMQMAKQLAMPAIAVSYGVHSKEQLQEQSPQCIVNSIAELEDLVCDRITSQN